MVDLRTFLKKKSTKEELEQEIDDLEGSVVHYWKTKRLRLIKELEELNKCRIEE